MLITLDQHVSTPSSPFLIRPDLPLQSVFGTIDCRRKPESKPYVNRRSPASSRRVCSSIWNRWSRRRADSQGSRYSRRSGSAHHGQVKPRCCRCSTHHGQVKLGRDIMLCYTIKNGLARDELKHATCIVPFGRDVSRQIGRAAYLLDRETTSCPVRRSSGTRSLFPRIVCQVKAGASCPWS